MFLTLVSACFRWFPLVSAKLRLFPLVFNVWLQNTVGGEERTLLQEAVVETTRSENNDLRAQLRIALAEIEGECGGDQ